MRSSILKRYALLTVTVLLTASLGILHALGRFPSPGRYDLARLIGAPSLRVVGKVRGFPMTRWGQTRFVLEGTADPLAAFHGRVAVQLAFAVPALAPNDTISVRGWLSGPRAPTRRRIFDERGYWAGARVFSILHVTEPEAFRREPARRSAAAWAWRFHQRFKDFWYDGLPAREAALLCCMTLGSRGILPMELKNQCIRAGVYHILVVSGQNMALIILGGVILLRAFGIPRRRAIGVCVVPILFYVAVVGGDPPVLRAAMMALVALFAMAISRDAPRYSPFLIAWLAVLWLEPASLFGASFQLSFGATASLMLLLPLFQNSLDRSRRWRTFFLELGCVSLAVHAGIWPLQLYYFHQISLVGFLANWLVFPMAGAVMLLGLVLGAWGTLVPSGFPDLLMRLMHLILSAEIALIEALSRWRWASIPLAPPPLPVTVFYYLGLIGILIVFRRKWRRAYEKIRL